MNKFLHPFSILLCLILTNCKTNDHDFPLEKRYWNIEDYDNAILELKYGYKNDEMLPTFNNPENRLIVEKLTDHQNYLVVLEDEKLGLKYKNEVASEFFREWKNMNTIYSSIDRKDQYVYEKEFLAIWQFGLGLQLRYFKLGNDDILKNADDPNSKHTTKNINSNIKTLTKNFLIYMDEIDNESAFSEDGKKYFAEGINKYFIDLIHLYPEADFNILENKTELMIKKSNSEPIKTSLQNLLDQLKKEKLSA